MKHAVVIEGNHITRHHFIFYLIGRMSEHSAVLEVRFVQFNGFLWGQKREWVACGIVKGESAELTVIVQPVRKISSMKAARSRATLEKTETD